MHWQKIAAAAKDDDDDCIFVEELLPSEELQDKAEGLQLPRTFYNYETAPACRGCIGCDPDSFDFDTIGDNKQPSEDDGKL